MQEMLCCLIAKVLDGSSVKFSIVISVLTAEVFVTPSFSTSTFGAGWAGCIGKLTNHVTAATNPHLKEILLLQYTQSDILELTLIFSFIV